MPYSRREFLQSSAVATLLVGCGSDPEGDPGLDATAPPPDAAPDGTSFTPCDPETSSDIEGPYYRAGAPETEVLVEPADAGVRLRLTGSVRVPVGHTCQALAGATLDVWHADAEGVYDLEGYRFRGILHTDDQGRYALSTIIPGRYLNGAQYRPGHIHVKVSGAGAQLLTTQLYFEGDPWNLSDPWFQESLLLRLIDDGSGGKTATFDFVLRPLA